MLTAPDRGTLYTYNNAADIARADRLKQTFLRGFWKSSEKVRMRRARVDRPLRVILTMARGQISMKAWQQELVERYQYSLLKLRGMANVLFRAAPGAPAGRM